MRLSIIALAEANEPLRRPKDDGSLDLRLTAEDDCSSPSRRIHIDVFEGDIVKNPVGIHLLS